MTTYNRINSAGTYTCTLCNKLTRDTGYGEAELSYCKKCLYACYMENAAADYGTDSQEYEQAKKNWELS